MRKKLKNKLALIALYFTISTDVFAYGIVISMFAPMILGIDSPFFSASSSLTSKGLILGFLLASFPIGQLIGAPLLGELADHFGRRVILLSSVAVLTITSFVSAVAIWEKNLILLFSMRLLEGLFAGNRIAAKSAIVDLSEKWQVTKRLFGVSACIGFALMVGSYLGGKLSDKNIVGSLGFSTPFLMTATLFAINLLLVLFFYRDTRILQKHPFHFKRAFIRILDIFSIVKIRTILIIYFVATISSAFFFNFLSVFLLERFQFSASTIGDFMGYYGLWYALTALILGKWGARKLAERKFLALPLFLVAVMIYLITLPLGVIGLYTIIPFIAIFQAVAFALFAPIASNKIHEDGRGKLFGIMNSAKSISLAVCPMISGLFLGQDYLIPIIISYSFFALTSLLAFLLLKIPHSEKASA